MPVRTAATPTTKLRPIGSPNIGAASNDATTGLSVNVLVTRVGDARSRAETHRKNDNELAIAPRYKIASHCVVAYLAISPKPPPIHAMIARHDEPAPIVAVTYANGPERRMKGRDKTL